ncbi:carboxypeptidase regulatory-like domain-containing protein [Mariniphaga sediminis]|uniref:Carboxypeptidase regulatory-like domain-containing protein n=1 Tax=Mariniphaga sediminis TaxID=1628158 RepID=A0A399CWC8_9BACT|nr:carboxypeptidase-like regulatory domain-containing protein [Mariniphaga sediminis]RIH64045.1 carboxypeptidase regulatory-like domain-containing protein [Mariniphaga sediminis]
MPLKLFAIFTFLTLAVLDLRGQTDPVVSISATKKQAEVLPGQIVNLAFFVENSSGEVQPVETKMDIPQGWKLISSSQAFELKPGEKKFLIFTVQVPSNNPVGHFDVSLHAVHSGTKEIFSSYTVSLLVGEVEKIAMFLVESPDYLTAGEELRGEFLLQNLGNTKKKVFFETRNCQVEGAQEIEVKPGESVRVTAVNQTSPDWTETRKEYYTVRALVSGKVAESIFRSVMVFPSKEAKKDLYFRFPVSASATYLATNQKGKYEHAYQFELSGSGALDPAGKHRLEFLARGPNNSNLSFLGMYDQYFVSYSQNNLELFAGEKAFSFTPLTESSRYGLGTENKVIFNNGLNLGFLYVKPRFYKEIENEVAAFTGFDFNKENNVEFFYISKKLRATPDLTQLFSVNSRFQPFDRTSVELEVSRGNFQENWDNALRANISSQFSIFNLAGNYFYTGKDYPGYFSNSTFYSGNFSVKLTPRLNLGVYAKEDFRNAQLDTFFVTAPYSKSFRAMINYNIASRSYLKFFWREYERKDRLALDKFHYNTRSLNAQFNQRFKKIEYYLLAEYGETANFLLESAENRQNTYRGSANITYRFNSLHSIRVFGSWSNINSFVSGEQRNLTAGMSVVSQIAKNLRANFHLQNAYDIDDYYRNRNLMQLNIDFTPARKHKFSLRSFYTLFRQQTEDPEFTFSFNYTYNFGIPLKKIIKAGDVTGQVMRENGEPAEGIVLSFQGKTTITDRNGAFSFRSVPAGRHLLFVDRSKLAIDEVTSIPDPFEVEVLEDRETPFHIKITKGTRLSGRLEVEESSVSVLRNNETNAKNIVVELKSEREQFRITSDKEGNFVFPLVRPGEWTFRVYTNSLPEGYEVEDPIRIIQLEPGREENVSVKMKSKKRKIIFKSQNNALQPLNSLKVKSIQKNSSENEREEKLEPISRIFYSVQVGAFEKKLSRESDYFGDEPYDFEKQIDNLHKYFIGRYVTYKEALEARKRLEKKFRNPFVAKFENDQFIQIEYRINNE